MFKHRHPRRPVEHAEPLGGRDDCRPLGRILIDVPGLQIDLTLIPDARDVRRWRAVDAATGQVMQHAAWPTILRDLAAHQPQAIGRRHWTT